MKLNKMSKNELELLSFTEIAKLYLEENKNTMTTADLFKKVCELLEMSEEEYVNNIADFFQSLSTSKKFILLDNGEWDLKSNHAVKVSIDEIYDDTNSETEESENTDEENEIIDTEEENDIDLIDNNDSYLDNEDDDDLADLTILSDEEIEE